MKKILITGANGYIGKNLSNYLIKKRYLIINLDKNLKKINKFNWKVDLLNLTSIKNCVLKTKPDYVIHLAARTDLLGKSLNCYKSNYVGTKNLIKACEKSIQIKRVIFASTSLVNKLDYKPKSIFDYNPNTIYGLSKVKMEQFIRYQHHNFDYCILRPTTIWGAKQNNHYKLFLKIIKIGLFFNIKSKKSILKKYGYIENSCFQIFKIITSKKNLFSKKIFYLCDYIPINLSDWTNSIAKHLTGKQNVDLSIYILRLLALCGDFFFMLGFKKFPIQTFRLNNMVNSYVPDNKNLQKITSNKLPVSPDLAIIKFIKDNSDTKYQSIQN
jgi:nucleoside-diphosphate-sugar epimerase